MGDALKSGILFTFLVLILLAQGQYSKAPKANLVMPENGFINNNSPDTFINSLLSRYSEYFSSIIDSPENSGVQVIYTQVERLKRGKFKLIDHFFNLNKDEYFYPASTVKLPVAILALQKLNELKIKGLDRNTTMITENGGFGQTEVCNDPSAADGRPTIAHYIKKILLASDNDAFNRLYEFLGQEYINNSLHRMGYTDAQIIHRLSISLTDEQNRQTNPVTFIDIEGKAIYHKQAENSQLTYTERNTKLGSGYIKGNVLMNEPFDFSQKNRLPLYDLHMIVRSIIYPEAVNKEKRFMLTQSDYEFLRKFMSMQPDESVNPVYKPPDYWDTYAKFLLYGKEKGTAMPEVRIFNKVGNAYGFLTDATYIIDLKNNIEFFLSAVIYCNSDGIFNDDKYDYENIGYPFHKNLGKVMYEYELNRVRKKAPDLSAFRFNYRE